MEMANAKEMVTEGGIDTLLANPSPDSSDPCDIVLQVVDLKPVGTSNTRFTFMANDGKRKLKAMLPTAMAGDVNSGKLQNLGLIRVRGYTCNEVPNQPQRVLIVTKCEVVSPSLDSEIGDVKSEPREVKENVSDSKSLRKPKVEETAVTSASEIVAKDPRQSFAPSRMGLSRRVYPLVSLNPYQGNWTIKVRVTSKGPLRSYKSSRGEGNVFNVELTDEEGTQIQATMFNEAADKFYNKFELGKVYYISKGTLRVANKQFKTVKNDYEMTLNSSSEVEEATDEEASIPDCKYNFVKIDELGPYVNGRELVDLVGVVQNVSPVLSIRRKTNNEEIPKRDVTIADSSRKTVVLSLWGELAKKEGQTLLDMVDNDPVVAIKGLKVSDFSGVSLSTVSSSTVQINPSIPEVQKLRSWYQKEGKTTPMTPAGNSFNNGTSKAGLRSIYSERAFLYEITNPQVGEGKPEYFNVRAYISFIKPDQGMWYRACKTCNRKVTEQGGSGYWCEGCQKHENECDLRYILMAKASDATGEAWLSIFNDQAQQIFAHTAEELSSIRSQDDEQRAFQAELKKAMWVPYVFRVSVSQTEFMNESRQRITVRSCTPVDWAGESKHLLDEIQKLRN